MFDTSLRRAKDRIGEPLAARLKNLSPNAISFLAFLVGILTAFLAARGLYLWALVFWMLSRVFDGLDGLIARIHCKQSDFGGYFDIILDFVIYAAVPIAIVLGAPSLDRYLALTFMLGAFYVNGASWMYLAAILEKRGSQFVGDPAAPSAMTSIVMPSGLVGATETILAYCAFLLWANQVVILFSIFGAMVVLTSIQRLTWAWRKLR
jgi:phosphatidylglycerophosphate synthase